MKDGALVASGTPDEVLTEALLADVFELEARVLPDPVAGTPMVVPVRRLRTLGRPAYLGDRSLTSREFRRTRRLMGPRPRRSAWRRRQQGRGREFTDDLGPVR